MKKKCKNMRQNTDSLRSMKCTWWSPLRKRLSYSALILNSQIKTTLKKEVSRNWGTEYPGLNGTTRLAALLCYFPWKYFLPSEKMPSCTKSLTINTDKGIGVFSHQALSPPKKGDNSKGRLLYSGQTWWPLGSFPLCLVGPLHSNSICIDCIMSGWCICL